MTATEWPWMRVAVPTITAIQKWVSEAGVETGRFVNELEGRL